MLTDYIYHCVSVPSCQGVLTRVSSSDSQSVTVCTIHKICHCLREYKVAIALVIYLSVVFSPNDSCGRSSSGDTG